jgi:very-short-patch-repair endonuclease
MGTPVEILRASKVGRVLTVFCDDVPLSRQHVRLASEELEPTPTLVGLEWQEAPALTREIDDIRDALADAALSLWPNWYTTVAQRFDNADSRQAVAHTAMPPNVSLLTRHVSISWLQSAWYLCNNQRLPIARGVPDAVQVQQLALALDPERLLCVLSVASDAASEARIRGVARAAEWLAQEAKTKTILLVPRAWQTSTELDHVTYGATTYESMSVEDEEARSVRPVETLLAPIARPPVDLRDPSNTRPHTSSRARSTRKAGALGAPSAAYNAVEDASRRGNRQAPHVSIGPICGRPHPKSDVEKLVYRRIEEDENLRGLFECNQPLMALGDKSYLVDLVWREGRLVVELDGPEHHSQMMYIRDRQRDYSLTMQGYTILRITNAEVCAHEEQAMTKIRNLTQLILGKKKGKAKREQ